MKNGILDIPTFSLVELAKFYKTSVDYLLGLTDEKDNKINSKCAITLCPRCTNQIRRLI